MMTKPNKVFNIELCPEDAQRIITALEVYKDKCNQFIEQCDTEDQKNTALLEWTYVSELAIMMENNFNLDSW